MKTQQTLIIEQVLNNYCFGSNPKLARWYGCEEVTIGFANTKPGKKKEIVDFLAYDYKNDQFRCYEIKISKKDLDSKAAKSWYGHYNYLVVSKELYKEIKDFSKYLTDGIGLIVCDTESKSLETQIRAKNKDVDIELKETLKNSLIRSLFYKKQKGE